MSSAHREEDVTKTKALSPPRGAGDITPSCAPQDASASAIDSPVAGRPHPREARMTTSESKSTSAPREHAQSRTTEPRDGGGGGGEGGADRGRARIRDTRSAPESRDGGGRDGGSDTDRQGIFERIRDTRSAPPPRAAALAAAGRLLQLSAPLPAGRLFTVVRMRQKPCARAGPTSARRMRSPFASRNFKTWRTHAMTSTSCSCRPNSTRASRNRTACKRAWKVPRRGFGGRTKTCSSGCADLGADFSTRGHGSPGARGRAGAAILARYGCCRQS